jgi:hypothetical protein
VDIDPDGDVVLLIVEEAVEDDTWERRDRRYQAFIPVPDVPTAGDVAGLRTAMGWGADDLDSETSRYHHVCIVAFPASPVRTWVAAFFAAEMPWLVDAAGLSCCVPPFDPRHTTPVTPADATELIGDWERLQPAPPPPPSTTPRRQPGSGRQGTGGFWSGPSVAVRAADPDVCHLRVGEGRRSFCGLRAKDLDAPDPYVHYDDVPDHRRCPECTAAWLEELRPQREDERRRVSVRLETVAGLLRAFDHLDAVTAPSPTLPTGPRRTPPCRPIRYCRRRRQPGAVVGPHQSLQDQDPDLTGTSRNPRKAERITHIPCGQTAPGQRAPPRSRS